MVWLGNVINVKILWSLVDKTGYLGLGDKCITSYTS